ncbi:MAG: hypothetical protein ACKPKO_09425 [Candidatus Fonsibacter sp.]
MTTTSRPYCGRTRKEPDNEGDNPRSPGQDGGGHQGRTDHRIEEVLPFFNKYKLELRVYDVFNNLIHRYDPEVPNFNHGPFYCVIYADHI